MGTSTITILKLFMIIGLCYGQDSYITLPAYYHDGMVMQADQDETLIWGLTNNLLDPVLVTVSCDLGGLAVPSKTSMVSYPESFQHSTTDEGVWEVRYLEMRQNGDVCSIEFQQENSYFLLNNVIFGDVWICSGQSNMVWPMYAMYNGTEEIANSSSYTNIRMYQANLNTSTNEEDDLIGGGWGGWYTPDVTSKLRSFSAVCFLFARELTDKLGGEQKKVFGLIQSAWGGTRIEAWSSKDALNSCNIPPNVEEGNQEKNSNSVLWNAMMHPFLRHNIYGVLWYQGESNYQWNTELYNCTFPSMIRDWREKWRGSDSKFPFGFVQLANRVGRGGVMIRWHQTVDHGYSPNSDLENVFMAVAMDTYDQGIFPGGLHPRYKQIVGERLAISGGNIAYGLSTPTNGPFPSDVTQTDDQMVEVTFDQSFTYSNDETSGFWYCCYDFDECNESWSWIEMDNESVSVSLEEAKIMINLHLAECNITGVQHLAYLWADTPVKAYLGAPIYSTDMYRLPAAPWVYALA